LAGILVAGACLLRVSQEENDSLCSQLVAYFSFGAKKKTWLALVLQRTAPLLFLSPFFALP
jgi:hypothetical protein